MEDDQIEVGIGRRISAGLMETYMDRFQLPRDEILEQQTLFKELDLDGHGAIHFCELEAYNQKFQFGFSQEELEGQFRELDVEGDGRVTFVEFLKVYVKGTYGRSVMIGDDALGSQEKAVLNLDFTKERLHHPDPDLEMIAEGDNSEEETGDEAEDVAQGSSGRVDMKLSLKRGVRFYHAAALGFLQGRGGHEPVARLRLLALGEAANTAFAVSARLQRDKVVTVLKLATDYVQMATGNSCVQVTVDLERIDEP